MSTRGGFLGSLVDFIIETKKKLINKSLSPDFFDFFFKDLLGAILLTSEFETSQTKEIQLVSEDKISSGYTSFVIL